MDKLKSFQLEKQIRNKEIDGFKVISLINNGKSAAVFKAEKDGHSFALKIFDNELIERFGHEIQIKRIEQEISLQNHGIDNLVKIYAGGNTSVEEVNYYYIVMELIDGLNLKEYIETHDYDESFVIKVLKKLSQTTEQLLIDREIAHRDIKPENIMVTNGGEIVLMDLGVLKLVGAKSFSDEEEKSFVGTLRYAAPEFLLRTEEDSTNGWRAVNTYQIGATLHDLIMKTELFHDKTPYSNLVIAIKDDSPKISNLEYSFELIQLSRDMLTKDWKKRLTIVNSQRIDKISEAQNANDEFESGVEEILKMRMGHLAKFDEIEKLKRSQQELFEKRKKIGQGLASKVQQCFDIIQSKGICSTIKKSQPFNFQKENSKMLVQNHLFELLGELRIGYPKGLFVFVRIENDEEGYTKIECIATFPHSSSVNFIAQPLQLFNNIYNGKRPGIITNSYGQKPVLYNFNTIRIFEGIVELDESFVNYLNIQLIKIIKAALGKVQLYVSKQLILQEEMATSKERIVMRTSEALALVIVDQF